MMPLRAQARWWRATAIGAALLLASFGAAHAGPAPAAPPQNPAGRGKTPPVAPAKGLLKLAEPWPDEAVIRQRHADAEKRRLFQGADPLTFTLTANFNAVNKDRNENSTKRFPATLVVAGDNVKGGPLNVQLGTRGHFRLRQTSCSFVPLRVEFDRHDAAGSTFDGQKALKLVTHCRDNKEYEQYTLREYLVYRIFNLVTPRSFRARLAKATYVDPASSKPPLTRYGMFLEDDDDVARRMDGRIAELFNASFKELDSESTTLMFLFEYMIGSTDLSIIKLHNVRLVQDRARILYPVPYDFDLAGLVDTSYALVDKRLGLASVRDRLYRGPCRTEAQLEPALEKFRATKSAGMALYDSLTELDPAYRRDARKYLEEFYSLIGRPDRVKKMLVDGCKRADGM
jgi:hypothetical protein